MDCSINSQESPLIKERPLSSLSLLAKQFNDSTSIDNETSDGSPYTINKPEAILNTEVCPGCSCSNSTFVYCQSSNSPSHIPSKRHCDSLHNECSTCEPRRLKDTPLARPIPRRPPIIHARQNESPLSEKCDEKLGTIVPSLVEITSAVSKSNWLFSRNLPTSASGSFTQSKCYHRHSRFYPSGLSKLVISPSAKSQSAFTPTRSIISPRASSDYSMSPEVDSPEILRPASAQSSGYHEESSVQSLVETSSLPDCSQLITNQSTTNFRCRSQPDLNHSSSSMIFCTQCNAALSANKKPFVTHLPMKRRRELANRSATPLSSIRTLSPGASAFCSTPIEQIKSQLTTKRSPNIFYFGSSRPYLVSLSRIATPPLQSSGHASSSRKAPPTILEHVTLTSSASSEGRGSQASTLTASSTGTPTNSRENMLQGFTPATEVHADQNYEDSCGASSLDQEIADYEMDQFSSEPEGSDKDESISYSSVDESDVILTTPKIFRPVVLANSSASSVIINPSHTLPFQELDLDQIEND